MELSHQELTDIKRALIIATQTLDTMNNTADTALSDRLELIGKRVDNEL